MSNNIQELYVGLDVSEKSIELFAFQSHWDSGRFWNRLWKFPRSRPQKTWPAL